jgi:hypothetical protein
MLPIALQTIAEIDERLRLFGTAYGTAPEDKKPAWMKQINAALDERIKAMAIRDGKATK